MARCGIFPTIFVALIRCVVTAVFFSNEAGPCQRVGDLQYDYLSNSSCSWNCTKCNSANYSLISTQDLSSFATNNPFSTLDLTPDCSFNPTQTSTPAKKKPLKVFRKTDSPVKIAVINSSQLGRKSPCFTLLLT